VAEGMSNSLLEAMATGLPCLASAIGGNIDLLEPGGAGLLLAPEVAAWSESIVRVLTEPDLALDLGTAARRRIEAGFSMDAVVGRYQEIYARLLSGETLRGVGATT
jgi:glycosyltransferase involved in cell wall biosynthesis